MAPRLWSDIEFGITLFLIIIFLQPLLQDGAVLVGLFDETSVAGAFEDLPAAVGDVLEE